MKTILNSLCVAALAIALSGCATLKPPVDDRGEAGVFVPPPCNYCDDRMGDEPIGSLQDTPPDGVWTAPVGGNELQDLLSPDII